MTNDNIINSGLKVISEAAVFTPECKSEVYSDQANIDLLKQCKSWFSLDDASKISKSDSWSLSVHKPMFLKMPFNYQTIADDIDKLRQQYKELLTKDKCKYALIQAVAGDCEDAYDYAKMSVTDVIKEVTVHGYQYCEPNNVLMQLVHEAVFIQACDIAGVEVILCDDLLHHAKSYDITIPMYKLGLETATVQHSNFEDLCGALAIYKTYGPVKVGIVPTAVGHTIDAHNLCVNSTVKFDGLNIMRDAVFGLAKEQGKYDMKPSIASLLMHMIGETNEAHEAYMADSHASKDDVEVLQRLMEEQNDNVFRKYFKSAVKSTFEDELADMTLMCLSIAGYYGIDLAAHVSMKHQYNRLRTEHSNNNKYDKQ
jgi:NTP pyrophosphatase (non-canonical NTP hydrolase)